MMLFYSSFKLFVDEDIYEPREDSLLIADYLYKLDLKGKKVLDMGTGSGILAIVACSLGAQVDAVDIEEKAIEMTKKNMTLNKCNFNVFHSDLFSKISKKYDVILFNPPYLPVKDDLPGSRAWSGGKGGVEVIERFLVGMSEYLKENGFTLLVLSSLSDLKIFKRFKYNFSILSKKKIPWETLYLIKISSSK